MKPYLLLIICLVASIPAVLGAYAPSNRRKKRTTLTQSVIEGVRVQEAATSGCFPQQARLSLGDHPYDMRVTWRTADANCPSSLSYGESSLVTRCTVGGRCSYVDPMPHRAYGKQAVYTKDMFCGSPATDFDLAPVVTHSVVLPDLEPGTLYFYQIDGANATTGSFLGPPLVSPHSSFTFLSYMDQGEPQDQDVTGSPGGGVTAQYALYEVQQGAAFVFHMGDVAYANGDPTVWEHYLSMIEGYSALVPYMVGAGNHETDYASDTGEPDVSGTPFDDLPYWAQNDGSGGECGVPYKFRFNMPQPQATPAVRDESNPPFWYSFDYGSAHFFVLSSEHRVDPGSPQHEWLKKDLEAVDRCKTPWVIGGMHRPLYVSKLGEDKDISFVLRGALEPLFLDNGVNMVLYGHTHYYERGCVVNQGKCVKGGDRGILHLSVGTGGHAPSSDGGIWEPWKIYSEDTYGYGRIAIQDPKKLLFEFVSTTDGLVHDDVTLTNSFDWEGTCGGDGGQLGAGAGARGRDREGAPGEQMPLARLMSRLWGSRGAAGRREAGAAPAEGRRYRNRRLASFPGNA